MIINKNEEVKLDTEEIKTHHDSPSVEKESVTSTEDKDNSSDDNNVSNDGEKISEDKDVETLPYSDDTKEEDKEETPVEDEEEKINEIIDKLIEDLKKGDENSEKIVKEILKKHDKVKNFSQIKTKLVIFYYPLIDYGVSTDVLSQYAFFKNAKHIFEKNNIDLIYFYELLPQEQQKKYYDIEENFKLTQDDGPNFFQDMLISLEKIYDSFKLNVDVKYIFHGWEPYGFDRFFENKFYELFGKYNPRISKIILHHDLHGFIKTSPLYINNQSASANILRILDEGKIYDINIYDRRLNECNIIMSPTVLFFKNIKSKYVEKTEFLPFPYNMNNKKIFELQDFDNYFNRERKILMSGSTSIYPHRRNIAFLKENIQESYLQQNVINLNQREQFSNMIEIMPYERYNRLNTKFNEERGILYLRTLSKYMGAFMCFADFPIDFHLCKLWEIMLSGCLAFVEPKDMLQTDLGLIPYVHYVPMLIDENNKLIIDIEYYNKYLGTEEGFKIAKQGFEYMRDNFTDEKVAEKYCEILKRRNLI